MVEVDDKDHELSQGIDDFEIEDELYLSVTTAKIDVLMSTTFEGETAGFTDGICADGEQEKWIAEGRTELDGSLPINTDGGCIACGEPIGATGLRQVYENVTQLRGRGGARQVANNPKTAYSHVYGAPGLSGITILAVSYTHLTLPTTPYV